MITTNLTGNLGNHMWQYAVCRIIAEHKGYAWGINPTPSHDYFNGKSQMEFMEMDYGKPVEGIINSFYERWINIQHVDLVNIAMLDKRIYDIVEGEGVYVDIEKERDKLQNRAQENLKARENYLKYKRKRNTDEHLKSQTKRRIKLVFKKTPNEPLLKTPTKEEIDRDIAESLADEEFISD
jgi:hypothetical protein